MQIDENSLYIEAIKLAAGSVQYKNWSVQDTFMDAVSQLYQYYQNSQNIKYLETAILHIQAYLEMGFPYEQGKTARQTHVFCFKLSPCASAGFFWFCVYSLFKIVQQTNPVS